MAKNPVMRLTEFGQSPWLDFIRRSTIQNGEMAALISDYGIRGVTSNPAIFEAAIAGSEDYDDAIRTLARDGKSSEEIYDRLSIEDVGAAADLFRPVYDETGGLDGYVSLEVSPLLARDTAGTIADAQRLWKALDRPNVMIKVPATLEGIPAIQQLIAEGININVTLLFSLERYRMVAEAFVAGLKRRRAEGRSIDVDSVASFFVSRIDSMVDEMLTQDGRPEALAMRGKAAIACSRCAYGIWKEVFSESEAAELTSTGARTQRVLWASTSTKNPDYDKVMYVEALVGPETVNTMPWQTILDYRESGNPEDRLTGSLEGAQSQMKQLAELGIDMSAVADRLEEEAIKKFVDPFNKLIASVEAKRALVTAEAGGSR